MTGTETGLGKELSGQALSGRTVITSAQAIKMTSISFGIQIGQFAFSGICRGGEPR